MPEDDRELRRAGQGRNKMSGRIAFVCAELLSCIRKESGRLFETSMLGSLSIQLHAPYCYPTTMASWPFDRIEILITITLQIIMLVSKVLLLGPRR